MSIISLLHLSKKYTPKGNLVLDHLSLEISQNEIIALLGESGSGKTTLLRLIAGLETPTAGEIFISGQKVASSQTFISPEKRKVGLVFQDYALFPHMSVSDNIKYGIAKSADKEKITQEVLALVNLTEFGHRYPHELSGGQQQRIALARALATKPDVLLLDEPFSNLDEGLKNQVRNDLKKIIRKAGITAIFVTHDTRDAMAIADKIALLQEGKLVQFDTPKQLYQQPKTTFVANYFDTVNWVDGTKNGHIYQCALGEFKIPSKLLGNNLRLGFRTHQFVLSNDANTWRIEMITFLGAYQEVIVNNGNESLTLRLATSHSLAIAQQVSISTTGAPIWTVDE